MARAGVLMPWTNPETFTAGQTLTAASMNALSQNVDFLREGRPSAVTPMCRVRRSGTASSAITPSTGSTGFLDWNTEDVDTETSEMWASGASTRITVRTAGLYLVQVNFTLDFSGTVTTRQAAILHTTSGGTNTRIAGLYSVLSQSSVVAETLTATFSAAVGDYFRVRIEAMTGASSVVLRADPTCTFSAMWMGLVP